MDPITEKVIRCMLAMQRYPWEQGVCAQALYEAGRDDLWIPMAYDAIRRQSADGRLAMIGGDAAVSDPASNGEVCFRAYMKTHDTFFLQGAQLMLEYLNLRAPRTSDGIICHNSVSFEEGCSAMQLWIDGLYMVPPFLAVMGQTEDAAEQIRGYIRHLYDGRSGLFFHIVDTESGKYVRKKHWATGNGWALLGLARVIEAAAEQGKTDICEEVSCFLNRLLDAMLSFQCPDGRFHDILDDPHTFTDGTAAMMTAAAIFRGILHGYTDQTRYEAAEAAFRSVSGRIDEMGLVREVCGCPDFLSEGTSAEAQAAFVMADAWRTRLIMSGTSGFHPAW